MSATPTSGPNPVTWNIVTGSGPVPSGRHVHSLVLYSGSLYVFGGYSGKPRNDFHVFNLATSTWNQVEVSKGEAPCPRHSHVAIVVGDKMVVHGGVNSDGVTLNDMYSFHFPSGKWTSIKVKAPKEIGPRFGHTIVEWNEKLFLFGGFAGGRCNSELVEIVFSKDTKSAKMSLVPTTSTPPAPRQYHSAVVYDDKMIIYGGYTGQFLLKDAQIWDFAGNFWRGQHFGRNDYEPPFRRAHTAVVWRNFMVVYGGFTKASHNDVHALNLTNNLWVKVADDTFRMERRDDGMNSVRLSLGRYSHAAVIMGDIMYIHGGLSQPGNLAELLSVNLSEVYIPRAMASTIGARDESGPIMLSPSGSSTAGAGGLSGGAGAGATAVQLEPRGTLSDSIPVDTPTATPVGGSSGSNPPSGGRSTGANGNEFPSVTASMRSSTDAFLQMSMGMDASTGGAGAGALGMGAHMMGTTPTTPATPATGGSGNVGMRALPGRSESQASLASTADTSLMGGGGGSKVRIKCTLEGDSEARVMSVPISTSFQPLLARLANLFGYDPLTEVRVRYFDEDDADWLLIQTDNDVEEAISLVTERGQANLKLQITITQKTLSGSASTPNVAGNGSYLLATPKRDAPAPQRSPSALLQNNNTPAGGAPATAVGDSPGRGLRRFSSSGPVGGTGLGQSPPMGGRVTPPTENRALARTPSARILGTDPAGRGAAITSPPGARALTGKTRSSGSLSEKRGQVLAELSNRGDGEDGDHVGPGGRRHSGDNGRERRNSVDTNPSTAQYSSVNESDSLRSNTEAPFAPNSPGGTGTSNSTATNTTFERGGYAAEENGPFMGKRNSGRMLPISPLALNAESPKLGADGSPQRGTPNPLLAAAGKIPTPQGKPREVVKRWQKGQMIGKGAFGEVFLGMDYDAGKLIAVKQITLDLLDTNQELKALNDEINLLRDLEHENVVRYLGSEIVDGKMNIFMEYVSGGSIAGLLSKFGAFGEAVIRRYTRQLLCGLEYLHSNGILHRDIKGANVLVDGNTGVVKLADFGASRAAADFRTAQSAQVRSFKGTPYWMAPEVIKQMGYGRKADIWSVGCTLYEMAVGKPPWSDLPAMTALFHIAKQEHGDSSIPIPEALSPVGRAFFRACLRVHPDERPNSAVLLEHPFLTCEATEWADVTRPGPFSADDYPVGTPANPQPPQPAAPTVAPARTTPPAVIRTNTPPPAVTAIPPNVASPPPGASPPAGFTAAPINVPETKPEPRARTPPRRTPSPEIGNMMAEPSVNFTGGVHMIAGMAPSVMPGANPFFGSGPQLFTAQPNQNGGGNGGGANAVGGAFIPPPLNRRDTANEYQIAAYLAETRQDEEMIISKFRNSEETPLPTGPPPTDPAQRTTPPPPLTVNTGANNNTTTPTGMVGQSMPNPVVTAVKRGRSNSTPILVDGDLTPPQQVQSPLAPGSERGPTSLAVSESTPSNKDLWMGPPPSVTTFIGHDGAVHCLQFDRTKVVSAAADNIMKIWAHSGVHIRNIELPGEALCLGFDESRILTGMADGTIRSWDVRTSKEDGIIAGHTGRVTCLCFDETTVASGGEDATIKVSHLGRRAQLVSMVAHAGGVTCLTMVGRRLVSGGLDATVRLWDRDTGAPLLALSGHTGAIRCVAAEARMLPTHSMGGAVGSSGGGVPGLLVVTGGADGAVRIWEVTDTLVARCRSVLQGHVGDVMALQIDNFKVVTAGIDGTLRVWRLSSGECLHELHEHTDAILCLQFSETRIYTGSRDRSIKLWDFEQTEASAAEEAQRQSQDARASGETTVASSHTSIFSDGHFSSVEGGMNPAAGGVRTLLNSSSSPARRGSSLFQQPADRAGTRTGGSNPLLAAPPAAGSPVAASVLTSASTTGSFIAEPQR